LYLLIGNICDRELKVHFLDVGQGDAILIEMPSGELVLIDGGQGMEVLEELGEVLKPWERKIDVVVLTHPHMDHMGGLYEVLDRYDVGELWLYLIGYKTQTFYTFLNKVNSDIFTGRIRLVYKDFCVTFRNIRLCSYHPNEISTYDTIAEFIDDLWGNNGNNNQKIINTGTELNNGSIVLLLSYGNFDILLTGDAEIEVENEISIGLSQKRPIEVLKAGHHCSKTASSEKLLRSIQPTIAICSCGEDNSFGHPHQETLDRFESLGIEYLRTDLDGRISVKSDGSDWWVVE
jgi:beta-lactamase superfamily II metal-dependent hydrolase